jgi:hypothetical protein
MPPEQELPFAVPQTPEETGPDQDDYVLRFRLEPLTPEEIGYDDPLLELIRGQLADVLEVAVLTYQGTRVMVDGFRLHQDLATQYEIHPKAKEE